MSPIDNNSKPFRNSLALGGLFLLIAMYFFRKKRLKQTNTKILDPPWTKIPGALPIFGNPIPGGLGNLADTLESWATAYGTERGVYECKIFGQRIVVLCNEEKIALVESHRPFNVTKREKLSKVLNGICADGLFSAEGDVWKNERKLFGPALNRKNVRDYVDIVKLVASRLVDKWGETTANEGVVTINSDLLSYTMDTISLVAFAKDIDSLRKGEYGIGEDIKYLLKKAMSRIFAPFPFWNIPIVGQYLDGCGWTANRVKRTFRKIIDEHESALPNPQSKPSENIEGAVQNRSKSFLGKILTQSKKDNSTLNEDRLIGNLLTMFVAGSETTFNTICSCLHQIAIDDTGLQDELAAEISALPRLEKEAGLEELNEGLPRMRSLVYEVLRIKGPSPFMGLENTKAFEMDGISQPPKTSFFLLFRHASTLESSEDNKRAPRGQRDAPVNKFCARRWLVSGAEGEENGTRGMSKYSVLKPSFKTGFRPFGSGMRVCPGRDLAEVEILVVLAFVLRKFEIELQEGHPPIKFVTRIAQTLDTNIRLVLKQRNK